jgi:hypothetical protein
MYLMHVSARGKRACWVKQFELPKTLLQCAASEGHRCNFADSALAWFRAIAQNVLPQYCPMRETQAETSERAYVI